MNLKQRRKLGTKQRKTSDKKHERTPDMNWGSFYELRRGRFSERKQRESSELKQRGTSCFGIGKRIAVIATLFAIIISGAAVTPPSEAEAAASSAAVPGLRVANITSDSVKLVWGKATGSVKGYTVCRNGKAVKNFKAKSFSFKDTNLEASTSYKYKVKAYTYKKKKVRQWYNKETGKWQTSKPERNIRGKSRLVKVKKYVASSPAISIKTQEAIIIEGRVMKPSQFTKKNNYTVSFKEKGTECSVCGEGVRIIVKYNPATGKYRTSRKGTDYSKKCHHHNTFDVFACNGDHQYDKEDAKSKCRWFLGSGKMGSEKEKSEINNAEEINPKTGDVLGTQTYGNHSDNFPKAGIDELSSMKFEELVKIYPNPAGDGKSVKCQGRKRFTSYKFCRDCKKILS